MAERLQIVIDVDGAGQGSAQIKRVKSAVKEVGDQSKRSARDAQHLSAAQKKLAQSGVVVGGAYRDLNGKLRAANGSLIKNASSSREAASANTRLGMSLRQSTAGQGKMNAAMLLGASRANAAGIAAAGLGAAILKSTLTGAKFEHQMDRVAAVSQSTGSEMQDLTKLAMRLGERTQFSAKEAADGMYQLATAGFDAKEVMDTIPGTLDLAAASATDLASASAIQAATIRGFGLAAKDATRVADVLTQTVNSSAVEMFDLGETIAYIAPVAKATGQSIEDMMAAVAIMGNVGIKGSMAGTALRTALVRLTDPPKKAQAALADLGIEAEKLRGPKGLKPIPKIMEMIAKGAKGVDKGTRNAALAALFGREALSGMIALVEKGPEAFKKQIDAMEDSEGVAKRTADVMRDNVAGAWDNFAGSVETASIKLSGQFAPALKDVLNLAAGGLNSAVKNIGEATAGLTGKRQEVGVNTTVKMNNGNASVVVKKQMEESQSATARAMASVRRELGLTGKDIEQFKDAITNVAKGVAYVWTRFVFPIWRTQFAAIRTLFGGFTRWIGGIVKVFSGLLTGDFRKMWEGIKQIFSGGLKAVVGLFKLATAPLRGAARAVFGAVKDVISKVWNDIGSTIAGFVNKIIGIINFLPFGKDIDKVNWGGGSKAGSRSGDSSTTIDSKGNANTVVRARGGYLSGRGLHDTVPVMAAPGEAILNRHQQGPVNAALQSAYGFGLPELFNKVKTPHYMAKGGIVGSVVGSVSGLTKKLPSPGSLGVAGEAGKLVAGVTKYIFKRAKDYLSDKASSLFGGGGGGSVNGLVPQVRQAIAFARKHGWGGGITSGFRSRAEQAALYARYLAGGNLAAPPGSSNHEKGIAIDVTDPEGFARAMSQAPARIRLYRKVPGEPWHFSTTGYAKGGFIKGKVSTFGPPLEGAGTTAYGRSSSEPGIAVNPDGGRNTWNNSNALWWKNKLALVKIGGKKAVLRVIDKGPSIPGRKIDVTGAGAKKMGISPSKFPTDAIGTVSIDGAKEDPKSDKRKGRKRKVKTPKLSADEVFNLTMSKYDLLESYVDPSDTRMLNLYRVERLRVINRRLAKVIKALNGKLRPQTRVRLTSEAVSLRDLVKQYSTEVTAESGADTDTGLKDLIIQQQRSIIGNQRTAMIQKGIMDNFVGAYAKGGPVNRTGMALVHEGEYVVPRKGTAVQNAAPSVTVNLQHTGDVQGTVEIDGRVVQTIDRRQGRDSRRMATAPGRL